MIARRSEPRRGWWWLAVGLLVVVMSASAASASPPSDVPGDGVSASRTCGTSSVYGRDFGVRPFGRIGCKTARSLLDQRCAIRPKRKWSCYSFRGSKPFIEWFPSKQLFDARWRRGVYLERYPCDEAVLTPAPFQRRSNRFPSKAQMVGDDIVRCGLLRGSERAEVEAAIGAPDRGRATSRHWDYYAGPQRDSAIQIDPEYLSVEFSADGRVTGASYYQD